MDSLFWLLGHTEVHSTTKEWSREGEVCSHTQELYLQGAPVSSSSIMHWGAAPPPPVIAEM